MRAESLPLALSLVKSHLSGDFLTAQYLSRYEKGTRMGSLSALWFECDLVFSPSHTHDTNPHNLSSLALRATGQDPHFFEIGRKLLPACRSSNRSESTACTSWMWMPLNRSPMPPGTSRKTDPQKITASKPRNNSFSRVRKKTLQ
jgi:hypothetical protein